MSLEEDWRTLWTAQPCVPFFRDFDRAFGGHQSGGRMAFKDANTLILSVGDHDLIQHTQYFESPQDPAYSHGKILELDIKTGETRIISKGHRNPQGLLLDAQGRIWSTEHAMFGGDELNLIKEGGNYGWPYVTLGMNYGPERWPHNPKQGRHTGYDKPKFAFEPSIGISQVIELQGEEFRRWKGDLLVASLKEQTLFRIRLNGDEVILAEPIPLLKGRLRDILELPDGSIAALTDAGSILVLRDYERKERPVDSAQFLLAAAARAGATEKPTLTGDALGEQVFLEKCASCHSVTGAPGPGPTLAQVIGRDIAGANFAYSQALQELDGAWSRQTLARYLDEPQKLAPGGSMPDPQVSKAEAEAVADYLAKL